MCFAGIERDVNTISGRAGHGPAASSRRVGRNAPSRAAIFFGALAFTALLIGAQCICNAVPY